ncbi:hypothetical protein [Achromobacter insuavis]|uniref:hypothetical protein n=1 Tax=Achromobacter insuavis TaxID=1287735 RepID=UPI001F12F1D1|nr:hypothetical protein [Achromobacter insuavis]
MKEDAQGVERCPLTFKAPLQVRAWLEKEAKAGYRTLGGQVLLIVERAMHAESQEACQ